MTAWITLGTLTLPHSEDVPTIQTAGSQMSFVLQPFNYFDSDPSQHVDDAIKVLAVRHTGTLVYQRQGDLNDLGDVIARDLDCLPVMVRKSADARTGVQSTGVIITAVMVALVVCTLSLHR